MDSLNLGYSNLVKREVVIEYYWKVGLTCDGEKVPELLMKPVWKTCFGSYKVFCCLDETKESVFEQALSDHKKKYLIP